MNNEEKILELLQALDAKIDRQKQEILSEVGVQLGRQKQEILGEVSKQKQEILGEVSKQKQEILGEVGVMMGRQKEELTTEINAAERRMQVLMESFFTPRFNLLAENQQIIQEKMATKEDLRDYREEMQAELFILKAAVKRNTMEIEKLKKAQ